LAADPREPEYTLRADRRAKMFMPDSVRLYWNDIMIDEDEPGNVHIKATAEGIVIDVVEDDQVVASAWLTLDDLIAMTH
jgi:hypothetical protein